MQLVFEILFPYLVALYMLDCIQPVARFHLLISTMAGRRFRLHGAGIRPAGLLPFDRAYLSHHLPVEVTSRGVYFASEAAGKHQAELEPDEWTFAPFEELDVPEASGTIVKFNGRETVKFPDASAARRWATLVEGLRRRKVGDRQRRLAGLHRRAGRTNRLQQLMALHTKALKPLEAAGCLLFFLLFVLLPTALYTPWQHHVSFNLLATIIVAAYASTLSLAFFSHQRLFFKHRGDRLRYLLTMIFSPVNAVHASLNLTRSLYAAFDRLTLCAALLPSEAFFRLARKEALRLERRLSIDERPDRRQLLEWKIETLKQLLEKMGVSLEELLKPPARTDAAAVWYCPACLAQYVRKIEAFCDCGAALRRF